MWQTTPAELVALVKGWEWRDEQRTQKLAWLAANLINVHLPRGKRIKPKDLLKASGREASPEERQAAFESLWGREQARRRRRKEGTEGGGSR